MAKDKSQNGKTISLKKEIYQQLTEQLTTSLPGIKEILGEKKFDSRIKKAAKLLSEGIKEKAPKKGKEVKKKASSKKAGSRKAESPEVVVVEN